MNEEYESALLKAKFTLVTNGAAFISSILFNLRFVTDSNIPTACVSSTTMKINPEFFLDLPETQRVFLLFHEAFHPALMHTLRKEDRDHKVYNKAGDYVINLIAADAGYELVPGALYDRKFRGMTTNEVYDVIYEEEIKKKGDTYEPDTVWSDDDSDEEEEAHTLADIVTQATVIAAATDDATVPQEVTRTVEEMLRPVLPWEVLLQRFMQDKMESDYSMKRPNRRYMPEFYLPSQISDGLSHLTIAIDTSGSISKEDLTKILSEVTHIQEAFMPKRMTIIDCDSTIRQVHEIELGDDISELDFSGGGCTAFEPVIDYCDKHDTTALLYFTDLWADEITTEPAYPVLWLCYSNHEPSPIGETIYYNKI